MGSRMSNTIYFCENCQNCDENYPCEENCPYDDDNDGEFRCQICNFLKENCICNGSLCDD